MKYKAGDKIIITNYDFMPNGYSPPNSDMIGESFTIDLVANDRYYIKYKHRIYYVIDEWIKLAAFGYSTKKWKSY